MSEKFQQTECVVCLAANMSGPSAMLTLLVSAERSGVGLDDIRRLLCPMHLVALAAVTEATANQPLPTLRDPDAN